MPKLQAKIHPLNYSKNNYPKQIYAKLHKSTEKHAPPVLALADPELIGKTLTVQETNAPFHISSKFYKGRLIPLDVALSLLFKQKNVNAVGAVVHLAFKRGYIHEDAIIWLKYKENILIPHVIFIQV